LVQLTDMKTDAMVVGGGLAGSEAAWQLAQRGMRVALYEMRPEQQTGVHTGGDLAELVCSNSLGSTLPDRASGVLMHELDDLGSLLLQIARQTSVPAGGALAVDRQLFAQHVTQALQSHPMIQIVRREVVEIPDRLTIIASGPVTSARLAAGLAAWSGQEHLYFYDAMAPIVSLQSIDFSKAYRASRYGRGLQADGDYINCPLNRDEYERFYQELIAAERVELKTFEMEIEKGVRAGAQHYFEGCLPIEIMAARQKDALTYGPMRPSGLINPNTGRWPFAVVQLRQDNLAGTLYNLVGFQTNLKFSEQHRIFRMIPGLEQAEFIRYGQMHRNTFIYSPALIYKSLQSRTHPHLFFAGQITGVEGYMGNIATGLLAGVNAARWHNGESLLEFPDTTMVGSLCHYITQASPQDFQPMKANFGILPPLEDISIRGKRPRAQAFAQRARSDFSAFLNQVRFSTIQGQPIPSGGFEQS
jgi:methylenetetrahydrofolate--tRNA-(uracil-5-)-methyltransferase